MRPSGRVIASTTWRVWPISLLVLRCIAGA